MKNRLELAKYFAKLGFKSGAEIGVWDGRYSELLCQNIPKLKLLAVDCWEDRPTMRLKEGELELVYNKTLSRLEPFDVTIVRQSSMKAVRDIPNESLDFVFIDADHTYESVKDDITQWTKKVRPGGIVSGHDYYVTRSGNAGVINAVDEYVKEHGYELKLTQWDKDNPVGDDRQPCWYFVK